MSLFGLIGGNDYYNTPVLFSDKSMIIVALMIVILILVLKSNTTQQIQPDHPRKHIDINVQQSPQILPSHPPLSGDPVKYFDYKTLSDPLTEPQRRPPRHIFNNMVNNPYFNVPVRGYPDSFSKQGYLIDESLPNNDPAKIIYLFGREKYPSSDTYDYYVVAVIGGNEVKIDLDKYTREFYGGETVHVPIVNKDYIVKLDKRADLQYNPYII